MPDVGAFVGNYCRREHPRTRFRCGVVEREFGRLKSEWALARYASEESPECGSSAELTILAKLACDLARACGRHASGGSFANHAGDEADFR
jgi:hypothetical protein